MAKTPPNNGKRWSRANEKQLRKLVKEDTPTPLIAWELGRSEAGVRGKASEKNISLKPTNKSPYNRQKRKR
jgi:hypothetical protein